MMNKRKPWNLLAIVAALALLAPAIVWAAYPAEVPRTGQTKCYDATGDNITCADTGQDGDWLAGVPWPDPRFVDNGDDTVLDNLTGLVWAKNANLLGTDDSDNDTDDTAGDGKVTWQHAFDYIKKLNRESYLGHSDWRLPNVNELESLLNAGLAIPALPQGHPFTHVQSAYYWSSTSYAEYANKGWIVNIGYGYVFTDAKTYNYFVWPVRSGQCGGSGDSVICLPKTGQITCYNTAGDNITCSGSGQDGEIQTGVAWPSTRFVDNGETVTDSLTGLEWTKNANLADATKTWQAALDYVKTLTTGSQGDWRLPNERELRSLADYSKYSPALPSNNPFANIQPSVYWSSTTNEYYKDRSRIVGLYDGAIANGRKTYDFYIWSVRLGQVGNPHISSTSTTTITGVTTTVSSTTSTTVPASTTTTSTGGGSTTTSVSSGGTTTTSIGGSTTTTTTTGSGPCPAKNVLGTNNPKLENLRDFRDSKLAQSPVGRRIINIYYTNADSINAALEHSPALRAATRRVLEVIAPMVGR